MNLQGKKVLVLGMGETGLSMAKWLLHLGADVHVADSRAAPPHLDSILKIIPADQVYKGQFEAIIFEGAALIAISPGVPLTEPLVQKARKQGIPVVGDIELFVRAIDQNPAPKPRIVAITGSNGKTTVTAMVGAMIKNAGWDVEVVGNIGPAALNVLMQRMDSKKLPQVWVLETSSFQLETTQNLNADTAAVLNISEDHLDRYIDMAAYTAAKERIFQHRTNEESTQILNRDDDRVCSMALIDRKQVTFGLSAPLSDKDFGFLHDGDSIWLVQGKTRLMKTSELVVAGLHNAANALAALAIGRSLGLPFETLLSALREFRGLPHRMEKVAAFNGVTFYDDSKSTNVGATVAALNGMRQKVVLIAGGDGKGQDFSPLRQPIADSTRAVVLIGRDAKKIAASIKDCAVPLHFAETMQEAMQISFLLAQTDDVVLLSPACASLDMFRNYIHRAEVFVAAVREIEAKFHNFGQEKQ
ncbi:MAG: UDP-N-acetylmuramoyl-L-alanine--D-glutamate ligase [Nitrosomonas sp.]|nr:UDP-N-acetylmuramoyl-L-alanine--D-glutamate ligase [Nitrosomonas sp.]MDP1949636.1 UDP-N-acetylmuramoyl-L-alanine--D-glutamate ligase [Nitrosomonas sp.]